MKIRCLLVDDEPPALKVLQKHLSLVQGFEVVAQCNNALEALEIIQNKTIDLIFLDIKMPHLSGIDFLKSLANPPKVILVTAYREFALESYDLDVVDYLLKPVSFERFMKAISKIKINNKDNILNQPNEYVQNPDSFIYLKVDKSMQKILLNDITYIESIKDYIKIFLTNNKTILANHSISNVENLLSAHRFLRVHRSYIISITKITRYTTLAVHLNDVEIPIGRLYKQQVMEAIKAR